MALHVIPKDGTIHAPTGDCGCRPHRRTTLRRTGQGLNYGRVFAHRDQAAPAGGAGRRR